MALNTPNEKDFQEAGTRPPKVAHEGIGHSKPFSCVLCNSLLAISYQSYCGDRACYKCLKLLACEVEQRWAISQLQAAHSPAYVYDARPRVDILPI